jgi:RNA polymerase sigma factor (TIGR02999 family)
MSHERRGHTLQATAVVHEAYQRLIQTPNVQWRDRTHFFALCAQLMRRILVDHARARGYLKRGGDVPLVSLDEVAELCPDRSSDLLGIDEALTALAEIDPRRGRVVELRFFGGLTAEETAEVLGVSTDTVLRDWKLAKVWLRQELSGRKADGA